MAKSESGEELARATGFTIQNPEGDVVLMTNRHVVRGRHQDTNDVLSCTGATPYSLVVSFRSAFVSKTVDITLPLFHSESGVALWREHPTHGGDVDVVAVPIAADLSRVSLFHFDTQRTVPTSTVPGGEDVLALDVGIEVVVVGYPFGETTTRNLPLWVRGMTASHPEDDYKGLPRFIVDARTREGQSGSPVFFYSPNGHWRATSRTVDDGWPGMMMLGVYSGRINPDSDLGVVWPTSVIREVAAGKTPPIDQYDNLLPAGN